MTSTTGGGTSPSSLPDGAGTLHRTKRTEGFDEQEGAMLFHVTWDVMDSSEIGQKRTLQLFSKWQPGPGQFQGFYGFADGGGGVALIEAGSAADLAKTIAPWTPFLKFTTRVLLPIQESTEINGAAATWRDAT